MIARTIRFGRIEETRAVWLLETTLSMGKPEQCHTLPGGVEEFQMKTREIKRDEAVAFFDTFSRQHEGWLTTVEVFGEEIGDQIGEQELALEGIAADFSEPVDKIQIMLGAKADDHITHTINTPLQISLEQTDEGAAVVLAVKAADGVTTLLRFRSAALPEMVDAVST